MKIPYSFENKLYIEDATKTPKPSKRRRKDAEQFQKMKVRQKRLVANKREQPSA